MTTVQSGVTTPHNPSTYTSIFNMVVSKVKHSRTYKFALNVIFNVCNKKVLAVLHILFHNSDKEFGYLVIKQEFRMILSLVNLNSRQSL